MKNLDLIEYVYINVNLHKFYLSLLFFFFFFMDNLMNKSVSIKIIFTRAYI